MSNTTKTERLSVRNYIATVFDGMAKGLFGSLIIGVVIKQIGVYTGLDVLVTLGHIAQLVMGPAIGAGVAYSRGAKQFTMVSAIVVAAIGAGTVTLTPNDAGGFAATIANGEPVGGFVAALIGIEIGRWIEGRTRFDLLLVPAAVIVSGGIVGVFVSPIMSQFMRWLGAMINQAAVLQPLPSGLLLGLIVGNILSSPISSAGVCIAIGLAGPAAGAAVAGCSAQMVSFAVASFRENRVSGLLGIGLGTSKLLLPNIVRNPWIWVPASVASALCGMLATMVFHMETNAVGAGMGTCAFVGQFTTVSVMGVQALPAILVLHFLIPAVVGLIISEPMRRKGLIKPGDMKLT